MPTELSERKSFQMSTCLSEEEMNRYIGEMLSMENDDVEIVDWPKSSRFGAVPQQKYESHREELKLANQSTNGGGASCFSQRSDYNLSNQNMDLEQTAKSRRVSNQNACKTINIFAIKLMLRTIGLKNLFKIKAFKHRFDLFAFLLLVVQKFRKQKEFQMYYNDLSSKIIEKIKKQYCQKTQKEIINYHTQTIQCLARYSKGNFEEAIEALYNIDKLKCKIYFHQSQSRLMKIHSQLDRLSIKQMSGRYLVKRKIISKKEQAK